jgi:hypothetical protein
MNLRPGSLPRFDVGRAPPLVGLMSTTKQETRQTAIHPPWACGLSMRQQDSRFILTPRSSKKHHFVLKSAPEARPLRGKPCLGP